MPKLVLLRGPCGAGKTTAGKIFAKQQGYAFIETDFFIFEMHPNWTGTEKQRQLVHQNLHAVAHNFIDAGESIVLEGVMVQFMEKDPLEVEPIVQYAKEKGYEIHNILMTAPFAVCWQRLQKSGAPLTEERAKELYSAVHDESPEFIIVNAADFTPEQTAAALTDLLR